MKNLFITILLVWSFSSCENPYENVSEVKYYTENPFVSLSSEQASIKRDVNESNNHTLQEGVFKDSLVLSHVLDHDITVELELVEDETQGDVDLNFTFQKTVIIEAGHNYGHFLVSGLDIPDDEVSKYKLSIHIKEVDDADVIAGLYGIKKENEDRKKRFKTYSFK